MRLALVVLAVVLLMVGSAGAQPRILIVDGTTTVDESIRLEAFARALLATGVIRVRAVLELPSEPWDADPFQVVIIVPGRGSNVWVCTSIPASLLPEDLRQAYHALTEGLEAVFEGRRRARGLDDDLYVWLLAHRLVRLGVLEGMD